MAAPKGNQFWLLRSSHGRKPIFKNPEELEKACYEYFETTSERTWNEQHWVGKDGDEVAKRHPTPFTLSGLYIFLDINKDTWILYRERKDFMAICTHVENIIYTQKFEGAATGFFNHAIIARDLGLKETVDNNISAGKGTTIIVASEQEAKDTEKLIDKLANETN